MFKKYNLSVKSIRDNFGSYSERRIFDIEVDGQEFHDIPSRERQFCKDCRFRSECLYYFSECSNYTPFANCINTCAITVSSIAYISIGLILILIFKLIISFTDVSIYIPILLCALALYVAHKIIHNVVSDIAPSINNSIDARKLKKMVNNENQTIIVQNFSKVSAPELGSEYLYSENILNAGHAIYKIKDLYRANDFKSCHKLVKECFKELKELYKMMEYNTSAYPRVSSLFETGVPELYDLLVEFSKLSATNCDTSELENSLNITLSKMLQYIQKVKNESILNSSEAIAKINFDASNEFLRNWIDLK